MQVFIMEAFWRVFERNCNQWCIDCMLLWD
jgi:hypothetical protein